MLIHFSAEPPSLIESIAMPEVCIGWKAVQFKKLC